MIVLSRVPMQAGICRSWYGGQPRRSMGRWDDPEVQWGVFTDSRRSGNSIAAQNGRTLSSGIGESLSLESPRIRFRPSIHRRDCFLVVIFLWIKSTCRLGSLALRLPSLTQ